MIPTQHVQRLSLDIHALVTKPISMKLAWKTASNVVGLALLHLNDFFFGHPLYFVCFCFGDRPFVGSPGCPQTDNDPPVLVLSVLGLTASTTLYGLIYIFLAKLYSTTSQYPVNLQSLL